MRIVFDMSIPNALWYLILLIWPPIKLVLAVGLIVHSLRYFGVHI
jgi:hypothetical protein